MNPKLVRFVLVAVSAIVLLGMAALVAQGASPMPESAMSRSPGGDELSTAPEGVCAASAVPTYTVTFTATRDAYVRSGMPSNNYGTADLYVGALSGDKRRSLVQFDLSALPSNAIVVSASLELYEIWNLAHQLGATAIMTVESQAVLASWDESTVTWNNQPPAESRGDPIYTLVSAPTYDKIDVTKIAQAWQTGLVVNNGVLLRNDAATTYYGFESRNGTHKPRLTIIYHTCAKPLTGVSISGPTLGVTGTGYTFDSLLSPLDATTPITYHWSATNYACGTKPNPPCPVGATATFTWTVLGTQTVTLTAKNCSGETFTATHTIRLSEPPAGCTFPLTSLTLNGPTTGVTGTNYAYTATTSKNPTYPVTYTWQASDHSTTVQVLSSSRSYRTLNWGTVGTKLITVTAQNCGGAAVANRAVSIVDPAQLPDLVITNAWYESDQNRVGYLIKNIGGGTAYAGHTTELFQGGASVAQQVFDQDLIAGAIRAGYINYTWNCGGGTSAVRLKADSESDVGEQNEANNEWQSTWQCDQTPPAFTTVPTVTTTTETTAVIQWTTNETTTGQVKYDTRSGVYALSKSDPTSSPNHQVTLTGLQAGQTYQYTVLATDTAGLVINSPGQFFATQPPGTDPPQIKSIGIVEYPSGMYEFYILQATLTSTVGVDRVSFFLDGQFIGKDYTPAGNLYEVYLSPAALGLTRADWFKAHTLQVQAYNLEGDVTAKVATVTPASRQMTARTSIQKIEPSNTIYIGGSTAPAGTIVTATVWAAEFRWGCYGEAIETPPPGLEAVNCVDVLQDVYQVALFLDGVSVGTYLPPTGVLTHDFVVDLGGKGLGAHTLKARATTSDGVVLEKEKTLTILSGVMCADVTRQVTRVGNYYEVTLTTKNTCSTPIHLDAISDRGLVGFYAADQTFGSTYSLQTTYDATTQRGTAEIDVFDGAQPRLTLNPGAQHSVKYVVVPILRDQEYSGNELGYSIGYENGGVVTYRVGTDPTVVGELFYKPWTDSVADALKAADYVIVTNPKRLNQFYSANQSDIYKLYATMARLAYLKQGALGFVETYCFGTLDTLLATDWANRLHPNFKSGAPGGYVLLVGETEIIPAWYEDSFDISWSNGPDTHFVADSDLPYASIAGKDKYPELALGRIIGNSPAALIKPIETSIAVWEGRTGYRFDRSNAQIVSGRGVGVTSDFIPTVNIIEDILQDDGTDVTKIHWHDYDESSYTNVFTSATPNQDIVYFFGHGNVGAWGPGLYTDLSGVWPLNFNGSNPFVYGTTCLSGGYEPDANSMPEKFFESGAGAYIGATQVSANSANSSAGKWFFRNWGRYETTGKVLTDLKQEFVSDSAYWRLWSYEYNFYGDPKYGAIRAGLSAQAGPAATLAATQAPSPTLDVHIPDYVVTNVEGWDYVEIPNGRLVSEPDRYQTPYWTVSMDYPAGLRAQAVTLTHRSDAVVAAGLHLTVTQYVTSGQPTAGPTVTPAPGWYPALDQQYSWKVEDNGDGTSRLIITIYPFYYDSATNDVLFHQDYSFDIQTLTATAQIESLAMGNSAYRPGQAAAIELLVNNAGAAQDVIVAAEIRSAISDTIVAGLPLRSLNNLTGTAQLGFEWDTTGAAPGSYYMQVELRDSAGHLLDSDARDFRVGVVEGQVTSLTATPTAFDVGQMITLSLVLSNTGSLPLNGTAYFVIQDESNSGVATLSQTVTNLAAGSSIQIAKTWNALAAKSYHILGYVVYNSAGTEAQVITINPKTRIYLPIVIR